MKLGLTLSILFFLFLLPAVSRSDEAANNIHSMNGF